MNLVSKGQFHHVASLTVKENGQESREKGRTGVERRKEENGQFVSEARIRPAVT